MAGESEKSPNRREPILAGDVTVLSLGKSGDRQEAHENWKVVVVFGVRRWK